MNRASIAVGEVNALWDAWPSGAMSVVPGASVVIALPVAASRVLRGADENPSDQSHPVLDPNLVPQGGRTLEPGL